MPNRLIAHQISKSQHSDKTKLNLRASLIPYSSHLDDLVQELRESITRRNPLAGKFTSPAGAQPPFQQRTLRYLAKKTDAEFVSLSQDATRLLEQKMKAESLATGGYVVFAEHEHAGEMYLLVVLLSTRAQPSFDTNLNLVSATTLDLEHLRHAARIRESAVAGNDEGVIHFVSKRSEGPSDYFNDFLGCEAITDPAVQGRKLYTVLDSWATDNKLKTEEREDLLQKTYSYWQDCRRQGKPIVITALANHLSPEDPARILKHLGNEASGLSGEFTAPPQSVMRQFVKFAFSDEGLKIEFDRNAWINKIGVNGSTVTIKQAPADLIAMIQDAKHAK
jgi:nucleoid-associated protein